MRSELAFFESAATRYMSNVIASNRESNPSRKICHLRTVPQRRVTGTDTAVMLFNFVSPKSHNQQKKCGLRSKNRQFCKKRVFNNNR